MTVADKIRQSVRHKPRPRLRRRVKRSELWSRDQKLAMSKLAEDYLREKHDAKQT